MRAADHRTLGINGAAAVDQQGAAVLVGRVVGLGADAAPQRGVGRGEAGEGLADRGGLDGEDADPDVAAGVAAGGALEGGRAAGEGLVEVGVDAGPQLHEDGVEGVAGAHAGSEPGVRWAVAWDR